MAEESRPWPGDVFTGSPGDAGPYSDDDWDDIWEVLFGSGLAPYNDRGVVRNWANELEVTSPEDEKVEVDTGAALVHGKFYKHTEPIIVLDVGRPPGGAGHTWREDLICLRSDWTAQTIRIERHVNPADEMPCPDPTRFDLDIWEIPLAAVHIDDTGAITLTDLREYVSNLVQRKVIQCQPIEAGVLAYAHSYRPVARLSTGEEANFGFVVPPDFISLRSAVVYMIVQGTGTLDVALGMYAAACGESETQHGDSATINDMPVTGGLIVCVDVSDALDGIGPLDWVGLRFQVSDFTGTVGECEVGILFIEYR